jgi:hypothetical protein
VQLPQQPREARFGAADEADALRREPCTVGLRVEGAPEALEPLLLWLPNDVAAGLGPERRKGEIVHRGPRSVGVRKDNASATCAPSTSS